MKHRTQYIVMYPIMVWLCVSVMSINCWAMTTTERKQFLDAIRPEAIRLAGQPVRFNVTQLNTAENWAVLVGELLAQEGKVMQWEKAKDCDVSLDKMLWVVAKKEAVGWKVKEIDICAPEPPYWYLEAPTAFNRPCGIYAELHASGSETVEQQCRAYQTKQQHRH